jgi:uncharacterized protein
MAQVLFQTQALSFTAEFNQCLTSQMILKALPMEAPAKRWGEEIYFETNIQASDFSASMDVSPGDIAYRHDGKRLCIFFGKTPISTTEKPVPEQAVVVVGRTTCQPDELRKIQEGQTMKISVQAEKPLPKAQDSFERKLSQAEIDLLVKKLLAEKSAKSPGGSPESKPQ